MAMTIERGLLASYLDDGGWPTEAENVRKGIDLESYEGDLRIIDWVRRHHLTQPAQAVDVPAIRGVIGSLHQKMVMHGDFYWDAAERLIRALAGEKAGWRDIATAPKDGTRVLVAYSIDGAGEIDGAMWCEPDEVWMLSDGFLCVGESEPTHWMPLPTPPTDGEE